MAARANGINGGERAWRDFESLNGVVTGSGLGDGMAGRGSGPTTSGSGRIVASAGRGTRISTRR